MNIKNIHFLILIFLAIIINKYNFQKIILTEENNDLEDGYDIRKIVKFNCTDPLIDCSGNGKCSENGLKCECNMGFQTFYDNYEDYLTNKPRCNYKSKQQVKALLFSLFLSFGSHHFYLGHKFIGTIQLLFFAFILIFNSTSITKLSVKHIKKLNRVQVKASFNMIIVMIILSILFLFWYLFDIIMIYLNIYKDSNNAKMYSFLQ